MEREEYKIKKNKYYTITFVIVIIFVAFEIICNFEYILKLMNETGETTESIEWEHARETAVSYEEIRNGGTVDRGEPVFYILADEENEILAQSCEELLENQKRAWGRLDSVEVLMEEHSKTVFVMKEELDAQEAQTLTLAAKNLNTFVFLTLPNEESLALTEVRELLGIWQTGERSIHQGVRFAPSFFVTDELMELEKLEIEMYSCSLLQKTKVFAYSLVNELEIEKVNEKLPPAIWRNSLKTGYVYCVNGNFQEMDCMKGIITALLGEIVEDDIYPVINGYGVMIQGMPYIRQDEVELVESLYSRDAMGLQQDILFPAMISSLKKNQYVPTFFAALGEEGSIEAYVQKQMAYMEKEIVAVSGEIGLLYEGKNDWKDEILVKKSLFDSGEQEVSKEMKMQFDTIVSMNADTGNMFDAEYGNVYIPVVRQDIFDEEQQRLKELAYITECGMLTVLVDIKGVLETRDIQYNWVDFSKQCETVLGTHNEYYRDFTRVTAEQLSKRILLYNAVEPQITKYDKKIEVEIQNFAGEAFFMLRTDKKVEKVSNGSCEAIGSNAYLIRANAKEIVIYLEVEEEAL